MSGAGRCGATHEVRIARAALHMWEEPCISGTRGSGAVFFTGCPLGCVYCQNREIALVGGRAAREGALPGQVVKKGELKEIFLRLQAQGANNINLVTPTHYVPQIAEAVTEARGEGLYVPVVYNTGSTETPETVRMLDGIADVFLPDLKYMDPGLAGKYSRMPGYFEAASRAIAEMVRIGGEARFVPEGELHGAAAAADGMHAYGDAAADGTRAHGEAAAAETDAHESMILRRGTIVRHMVLPGHTADSKRILEYLYKTYGDAIFISILSQYTPMPGTGERYPELGRRVTRREYDRVVDYALSLGIRNAFIQERGVADESFIPAFDRTGLGGNGR